MHWRSNGSELIQLSFKYFNLEMDFKHESSFNLPHRAHQSKLPGHGAETQKPSTSHPARWPNPRRGGNNTSDSISEGEESYKDDFEEEDSDDGDENSASSESSSSTGTNAADSADEVQKKSNRLGLKHVMKELRLKVRGVGAFQAYGILNQKDIKANAKKGAKKLFQSSKVPLSTFWHIFSQVVSVIIFLLNVLAAIFDVIAAIHGGEASSREIQFKIVTLVLSSIENVLLVTSVAVFNSRRRRYHLKVASVQASQGGVEARQEGGPNSVTSRIQFDRQHTCTDIVLEFDKVNSDTKQADIPDDCPDNCQIHMSNENINDDQPSLDNIDHMTTVQPVGSSYISTIWNDSENPIMNALPEIHIDNDLFADGTVSHKEISINSDEISCKQKDVTTDQANSMNPDSLQFEGNIYNGQDRENFQIKDNQHIQNIIDDCQTPRDTVMIDELQMNKHEGQNIEISNDNQGDAGQIGQDNEHKKEEDYMKSDKKKQQYIENLAHELLLYPLIIIGVIGFAIEYPGYGEALAETDLFTIFQLVLVAFDVIEFVYTQVERMYMLHSLLTDVHNVFAQDKPHIPCFGKSSFMCSSYGTVFTRLFLTTVANIVLFIGWVFMFGYQVYLDNLCAEKDYYISVNAILLMIGLVILPGSSLGLFIAVNLFWIFEILLEIDIDKVVSDKNFQGIIINDTANQVKRIGASSVSLREHFDSDDVGKDNSDISRFHSGTHPNGRQNAADNNLQIPSGSTVTKEENTVIPDLLAAGPDAIVKTAAKTRLKNIKSVNLKRRIFSTLIEIPIDIGLILWLTILIIGITIPNTCSDFKNSNLTDTTEIDITTTMNRHQDNVPEECNRTCTETFDAVQLYSRIGVGLFILLANYQISMLAILAVLLFGFLVSILVTGPMIYYCIIPRYCPRHLAPVRPEHKH